MLPLDVGVSIDDPWFGYVSTAVEFISPDAGAVVVRAAPAGDVGVWPWATEAGLLVLTAWDPGEEHCSIEMNRARQSALDAELRPRAESTWRARGFDPSTGYRDEGVAVRGMPERDVCEVGARYGQDAVFAWTPSTWTIVACVGARRLSLGWRITAIPTS
jgi:Protein of unknown function (DUF3293)